MENTNLIELLKVLTNKELRKLSTFLTSPFHNKGKYRFEALFLFNFIKKFAPNYDNPRLTREILSKNVFQDNLQADIRIDKVMSELSKSIRFFLLTEYYFDLENTEISQLDFIKILMERKASAKAVNLASAVSEELKLKEYLSTENLLLSYRVSYLLYELEAQNNTWRKDLNIKETLRNLDLFYFSSRTNLINHSLLLNKMSKIDAGINLDNEHLLQAYINIKIEESPTIFLAQKTFELYSNTPTQEAFNDFFNILNQLKDTLNEIELKQYFTHLRNYCNHLIGLGRTDLWLIYHDIQKDNLEKGYYHHYANKMINCGSYINIVNAALNAQNFTWCLNFIETHQGRIFSDNETNDYYRLGKANYLFFQKKYDDALDFIPSASNNLDFHIMARRLELMVYYEMDANLLTYKIDAFKMYLSRGHKKLLSDDIHEMNSNFVNIVYQLNQSHPGDINRKTIILQRIEEKKQLVAKDWLIKKVGELR
jgi:hypothetical protein